MKAKERKGLDLFHGLLILFVIILMVFLFTERRENVRLLELAAASQVSDAKPNIPYLHVRIESNKQFGRVLSQYMGHFLAHEIMPGCWWQDDQLYEIGYYSEYDCILGTFEVQGYDPFKTWGEFDETIGYYPEYADLPWIDVRRIPYPDYPYIYNLPERGGMEIKVWHNGTLVGERYDH